MDRINKFLETRQIKNQKNIKYKNQKFKITKEDLKLIRKYKSGKCLDSALKDIPNRVVSDIEPEIKLVSKKDKSEYFNKKGIKDRRRKEAIIIENLDVWDEELEDLNYDQEWIYSIKNSYEGKIEDLQFRKEDLEQELNRVFMKHFKPRDLKSKLIKDLLPKLPNLEELRPFPEEAAFAFPVTGSQFLFNHILCSSHKNKIYIKNLKTNKIEHEGEFQDRITKASVHLAGDGYIAVISTSHSIYHLEDGIFKEVLKSTNTINDLFINSEYFAYSTKKSVFLFDSKFNEIKALKIKGDISYKVKISGDRIFTGSHKGIIVEGNETQIKNIGYVIDFAMKNGSIYALNNQGRIVVVDSKLKVLNTVAQSSLGYKITMHPIFDMIAILYSTEIGIYKVHGSTCLPVNTIEGNFKEMSWDLEMPYLYAATKDDVILYT